MEECLNCSRAAVRTATLESGSGHVLADGPLCRRCAAFFEASAHIELSGEPPLERSVDSPAEE